MNTPVRLSPTELLGAAVELADLLVEAVSDGASLGFLAPLDRREAITWWSAMAPDVAEGRLVVWAAYDAGRITGTISFVPGRKANARHRAEIAKLLVRKEARGQGLARRLLAVAEHHAAETGVILLMLDTQTDSAADRLYRREGWTAYGTVPDYAADPAGVLQPCTFFRKALASA
ncbi:GNAT family N-acetyltransferase [Streptomyces beijiangensis]|uniref:GNAT family N-acetyltransferase n=1 Tax=Streptomyces beijiangensis TaxID=163361 RepID=A0A939JIT2_9ACTN|nr:GNAT family N-acetyltransferase [Streptomyces beijiangensis]MBO0513515.1 GNAT family N-acetyltransferase [Streptomyces beijiangensis]